MSALSALSSAQASALKTEIILSSALISAILFSASL